MLARLTLALKNNTSKHQSNQKVPLSLTEYSVSGLSEHVCVCVRTQIWQELFCGWSEPAQNLLPSTIKASS